MTARGSVTPAPVSTLSADPVSPKSTAADLPRSHFSTVVTQAKPLGI